MPAVAIVLLLRATKAHMEDSQAENLNLLPVDEHNKVLNCGMKGIYLFRLSLSF